MYRNSIILVLLGVGLVLSGCDDQLQESTQTFKVTEVAIGSNIRLLTITSKKYYLDDKEKEVRTQLEAEVNSGQRNIIAMKTSYSSGHLTSGEITYDTSGAGTGNNLRVLFIYSDKYYWNEKEKEVQPKLSEIVNSGKYDIVKIQTVYTSGRLFAAEVYYCSK